MNHKTGYVQFIDGNKITVDGEKYSAFAASQIKCSLGEYVEFDYVERPSVSRAGTPIVYKNIKGNVVGMSSGHSPTVSGPPTHVPYKAPEKVGEPILAKDRLILRQNALGNAVLFLNGKGSDYAPLAPELVIEIAKKFEYYTSGDMDVDAAEKVLSAIVD